MFNEELNTVNSQLQCKIGELASTTNDLNNLLVGPETATVFLDETFCIRWFSPAIKDLLDLAPSDVGRPISAFAQKFFDENLLRDAEAVLKKLTTIKVEVPSGCDRWYTSANSSPATERRRSCHPVRWRFRPPVRRASKTGTCPSPGASAYRSAAST